VPPQRYVIPSNPTPRVDLLLKFVHVMLSRSTPNELFSLPDNADASEYIPSAGPQERKVIVGGKVYPKET